MFATVLQLIGHFSYAGIFGLLLATGVGAPLSEDLILVATGALVGKGICGLWPALLTAYLGVVLGDLALYGIGRKLGARALRIPFLARRLPPARMERVSARFKRWGPLAVIGARFAAGTRTPTFLAAGLLRVPWRRFLLADAAGALITVPLTVLLARAGVHTLSGAGALGALEWVGLAVLGCAALGLLARWTVARILAKRSARAGWRRAST